jgi:hypothetical protein
MFMSEHHRADHQQDPCAAEPHDAAQPNLADQQAQDAQYFRRVLLEFIDIGADLMRLVRKEAHTQAEYTERVQNTDPYLSERQDPTVAFERITRAVRRTMVLVRKLNEPLPPPAASKSEHRTAARKRIIRDVEDTIQRTTKDDEAESLHAELLDRLDGPDLDEDIDQRPVAEIITDICRDLGIANYPGAHPWKRRKPADIAVLSARAANLKRARAPASPAPASPAPDPPASEHPPPVESVSPLKVVPNRTDFRDKPATEIDSSG